VQEHVRPGEEFALADAQRNGEPRVRAVGGESQSRGFVPGGCQVTGVSGGRDVGAVFVIEGVVGEGADADGRVGGVTGEGGGVGFGEFGAFVGGGMGGEERAEREAEGHFWSFFFFMAFFGTLFVFVSGDEDGDGKSSPGGSFRVQRVHLRCLRRQRSSFLA